MRQGEASPVNSTLFIIDLCLVLKWRTPHMVGATCDIVGVGGERALERNFKPVLVAKGEPTNFAVALTVTSKAFKTVDGPKYITNARLHLQYKFHFILCHLSLFYSFILTFRFAFLCLLQFLSLQFLFLFYSFFDALGNRLGKRFRQVSIRDLTCPVVVKSPASCVTTC